MLGSPITQKHQQTRLNRVRNVWRIDQFVSMPRQCGRDALGHYGHKHSWYSTMLSKAKKREGISTKEIVWKYCVRKITKNATVSDSLLKSSRYQQACQRPIGRPFDDNHARINYLRNCYSQLWLILCILASFWCVGAGCLAIDVKTLSSKIGRMLDNIHHNLSYKICFWIVLVALFSVLSSFFLMRILQNCRHYCLFFFNTTILLHLSHGNYPLNMGFKP